MPIIPIILTLDCFISLDLNLGSPPYPVFSPLVIRALVPSTSLSLIWEIRALNASVFSFFGICFELSSAYSCPGAYEVQCCYPVQTTCNSFYYLSGNTCAFCTIPTCPAGQYAAGSCPYGSTSNGRSWNTCNTHHILLDVPELV